jgi:hypothetical protein
VNHAHSFITFDKFLSSFLIAVRSGRGPPLGAKQRFEHGATLQQPNSLPTEPRRTLLSHAVSSSKKLLNFLFIPERQLSTEAKNAEKIVDIWGCLVTDELLEVILLHTNEKIRESADKQEDNQYSSARLKKSPYLKETDKVSYIVVKGIVH